MTAEWRGEVPTWDVLNRLVTEPFPLGLRSGPAEPFFQRDIYFDSADWTLRRRGVSCRFRIRVDDRRILTLRTIGRWDGGVPLVLPQTFEADVPELEGAQALTGTSDPARRLRALIEPGLLLPRIQLETERRLRHTRAGWLSRGRYDVVYDVVTVRSHQRAQTFQELKLRELARGRPGLDRLARAFQDQYGLRPLLVGKVDRAAALLRDLESGALAQVARGGREVALVAVEEGSVAMLMDSSSLTLPVRSGQGEETCREILRAFFGSADGQVRFLGTAPGGLAGMRPVLEFNARVLELAEDPSVPLLARIRFLSVLSGNLDEFFMVRVDALKRAAATGGGGPLAVGVGGLGVDEEIHAIGIRVRALLHRQARCFTDVCLPALAARGVRVLRWSDLAAAQQELLRRYFREEIFPFITPQAMTRAPGHPFPLIANLRLSLAVVVRDAPGGPMHFAYLKVPEALPRFVKLADESGFVAVEDIIRANLSLVYPGRFVEEAYAFRVTRGADLELDEHHAVSLLQVIEEETKRRPYGAAVRVEIAGEMPEAVRELLLRELQFEEAAASSPPGAADLYAADGLLDLGGVRELARLPLPDLDYTPHQGGAPLEERRSIFTILAERDVLVHHPYDAFEATVQRLVVEAADDPDVVAIKLTLYRAGGRSEIVDALLRAAGRAKEVFVFVELKARFDEERNIEWAKKLEQAGIRVVYGLVDFKTHAKTALVVRRERDGIRRYVHIGTGNYNAATAAIYTDLGLLSADPELGADLNDLFNELSGSSRPPQTAFRRILVAPTYLAKRLVELVPPVRGGAARARLDAILRAELEDPTAWDLDPDGSYHRRAPAPGGDPRGSQERLLGLAGATA